MTTRVQLFTDGACRGNPGPGGWGFLLRYGAHEKEGSGFEVLTTNNRMELTAVIEGVRAMKRSSPIDVYTDSTYVKEGMTQWLPQWKTQNWRSRQKKEIKNVDLWQTLDALVQTHQVIFHWVRGHSGHPENERVDRLAVEAIDHGLKALHARD